MQVILDRRAADKSPSVLNPYYATDKIENLLGSGSACLKPEKHCMITKTKQSKKQPVVG
jgi:hypothetical protein